MADEDQSNPDFDFLTGLIEDIVGLIRGNPGSIITDVTVGGLNPAQVDLANMIASSLQNEHNVPFDKFAEQINQIAKQATDPNVSRPPKVDNVPVAKQAAAFLADQHANETGDVAGNGHSTSDNDHAAGLGLGAANDAQAEENNSPANSHDDPQAGVNFGEPDDSDADTGAEGSGDNDAGHASGIGAEAQNDNQAEENDAQGSDSDADSGGGGGSGAEAPIVLDLDGDGVELVSLSESGVFFDFDGDDFLEHVAWVSADDGLLVYDKNLDDDVTDADEIVFTGYVEGATTDLEGLQFFDSNQDGVLDSSDSEFSKFKIWQDVDQDGNVDSGELRSLSDENIESISLTSDGVEQEISGNTVFGTGTYTYTDGSTADFADASLVTSGYEFRETPEGHIEFGSEIGKIRAFESATPMNYDIAVDGDEGLVGVLGGDNNDYLFTSGSYGVILSGGLGDDVLVGSIGNDWISGDAGSDRLLGGAGQDVLFIDNDDLEIDGGEGVDIAILTGGAGHVLNLSATNLEIVIGGTAGDTLDASGLIEGALIRGGAGDDVIVGGAGVDVLAGDDGADTISGGAGNDFLFVDSTDTFSGGSGVDALIFNDDSDLNLNVTDYGAEIVVAGNGNDTLSTDLTISTAMFGGGGNDTLNGSFGGDRLAGGKGSDTLVGGFGNDTYVFHRGYGSDVIRDHYENTFTVATFIFDEDDEGGGSWQRQEEDRLIEFDSGLDTLEFGPGITAGDLSLNLVGNDLIVAVRDPELPDQPLEEVTDRITIKNWTDPNDRVERFQFHDGSWVSIPDLSVIQEGTTGDDTIAGGATVDWLIGGNGEDTLAGGAETDVLIGGAGNDTLSGDAGNDRLEGGAGDDIVDGNLGDDVLYGGDGTDTIDGGDGNDFIRGQRGDDTVIGGVGADILFGDDGNDNLIGNADYDILIGGAGDDTLTGGEGDDILDGGAGDDTAIYGGNYANYNISVVDGRLTVNDTVGNDGTDTLEGVTNLQFADQLVDLLAPVANGDIENINAIATATIASADLLANDVNDMGTSLSITAVANVTHGAAQVNADGDVLFTPTAGFSGIASFDYTVENSEGNTDTATATLVVTPKGVTITHGLDAVQVGDGDANTLTGTADSDALFGDAGADTLDGGAGDDLILADSTDTVIGGAGTDTVVYLDDANQTLDVAALGVERIYAGGGDNTLTGTAAADLLAGGAGTDSLAAGGGNDTYVFGFGDGADNVTDYYETTESEQVLVPDGYWDDDGEGGSEWVDTSYYVTNYFQVHQDGGLDAIEFSPDVAVADVILRLSGNDLIVGLRDPDNPTADFASLADKLTVTNWAEVKDRVETLRFADGTEISIAALATAQEAAAGGSTLTGGGAVDWLAGGEGADVFSGGDSGDALLGAGGDDTLDGDGGDDTLAGGRGTDTLDGGAGADALSGGDGDDTLTGGTGDDTIDGGVGTDTAVFTGDLADYQITNNDDGTVTVTAISGSDGVDTLSGVEFLEFADQTLDLSLPVASADVTIASPGITKTLTADTLVANDFNPTGEALSIISVGNAPDGTVELTSDGDVRFTANAGFGGITSFDYTVELSGGGTSTGQVTVAVAPDGIDLPLPPSHFIGTDGAETLAGGIGDDVLFGGGGADTLNGGDGDDLILADSSDTISGGAGSDTVVYMDDADQTLDAAALGAERIYAGGGNDTLTGTIGTDVLVGGAGTDTLLGGGGDDVYGFGFGDGIDSVSDHYETTESEQVLVPDGYWDDDGEGGSEWVDTSYYVTNYFQVHHDGGSDTIEFGPGVKLFDVVLQLSGNDLIVGLRDPDNPTADFASLTDKMTVTNWAEAKDRIETLRFHHGTEFSIADLLTAQEASVAGSTLTGGAGKDWLAGHIGNDILSGSAGDDILTGDAGDDTLSGGDGADHIAAAEGDDTLHGDAGDDKLFGGSGNDELFGGDGNDKLDGDVGSDRLEGGLGDDILEGEEGNDLLIGGTGVDSLRGDSGDDILDGGAGDDTLDGGTGTDTAVYVGARSDYQLTFGTDTITVVDTVNGEGTDTLENIERFRFDDGEYVVDGESIALAPAAPTNMAPTAVSLTQSVTTLTDDVDTSSAIKVADIQVTDDGLGTNTLSLSGDDAALFEIVGTELFLKAGTSLDAATNAALDVTVSAEDTALGSTPVSDALSSITVTAGAATNTAPTAVSLTQSVTTLADDADTSSAIKVADIQVTDDGLGTNTLSLSGDDAALFEIVGTELFLKAGTSLDAATNAALDVTVSAEDTALGSTPVSDALSSITVTAASSGTPVRVQAEDFGTLTTFYVEDQGVADSGQVIRLSQNTTGEAQLDLAGLGTPIAAGTYTITVTYFDENDGASSGELVVDGTSIGTWTMDEATSSHLVEASNLRTATFNSVSLAANSQIVLKGTSDADEFVRIDYIELTPSGAPTNTAPTAVSLTQSVTTLADDVDTSSAIKVADIQVTDDGLGTNTLSLSGDDAALFEIVGAELFLKAGTSLDAATNAALDVTVLAEDTALGSTPVSDALSSITVTAGAPTNTAPTAVSLTQSVTTLAEDTDTSSAIKVADIQVTDDGLGTNTLSLSGDDAALFEIVGTELFLKAGTSLDAATNAALDVTVSAEDTALGSTPVSDALSSITVTAASSGTPVRIQAEDFDTLTTYYVEDQSAADGGQVIRLPANTTGNAELNLANLGTSVAAGNYSVTIAYFDENDGQSSIDLLVDGTTVGSWNLDEATSGDGAEASNIRTVTFESVALTATSLVRLDGTAHSGEMARIDYIELTPTGAPTNTGPTAIVLPQVLTSLADDADTSSAIKVADIQVTDDGLGTNTLSLSGDDAALFEIVGTELFLKAGTSLDAATNAALDVTVSAEDTALGSTPVSAALSSITVTAGSSGTPVRVQAEDFDTLTDFVIEDQSFADGGQVIRLGQTSSGTAQLDLSNLSSSITPGQYDVAITYYDESDGVSNVDLKVDGSTIGSWSFDEATTESLPDPANERTVTFESVTLDSNSQIVLDGLSHDHEYARIDYIDITPAGSGSSAGSILIGDDGNNYLVGGVGDDTLSGGAGNDTLTGGEGNDTLQGNAGDDTYLFGRGDGHDTLDNIGSDGVSNDKLVFGDTIDKEQLWFTQAGDDLNIRIVGSDHQVTVADWYTDTTKRIDTIETDAGDVLTESAVQQLVSAMAAFSPPTGTDQNLSQQMLDDLQPTMASAWSSST